MKSISDLKAIADDLFRKHIHSIYPKDVCCPTCPRTLPNNEMTVGHAFRRNELSVRYDSRFATLQCGLCNTSGIKDELLKDWFRKRIANWDDLAAQERQKMIRRPDLEEIIHNLKFLIEQNQWKEFGKRDDMASYWNTSE